jgi:holo-[acyl-carrier protein] synthase
MIFHWSSVGPLEGPLLIGIGIDLVDPARVEAALARWGERFVAKLMDPEEARALPAEAGARARSLARSIGLKEAASKAIGTGWSRGVRWRDVVAEPDGPAVRLAGRALAAAHALGSSGRTRAELEVRHTLVVAQVWLLA